MKLLFRQRFFSWLDSYDIYDEAGNTVFTVRGALSWGHLLRIYDGGGREIGCLKEKIFTFLPRFEMYAHGSYIGSIRKELSFFRPKFNIDCNGWRVDGNWFEWDYAVINALGMQIAAVSKAIWNFTDSRKRVEHTSPTAITFRRFCRISPNKVST